MASHLFVSVQTYMFVKSPRITYTGESRREEIEDYAVFKSLARCFVSPSQFSI